MRTVDQDGFQPADDPITPCMVRLTQQEHRRSGAISRCRSEEAIMALSSPEVVSRESLIERLRPELLRLTGDDRSICRMAAERGIFCHGFSRFSDADLRRRLHWIAQRRPDATRPEMEDLGDRWQLARQEVDHLPTACDVQAREHDLCGGWDDFSDEDLVRLYEDLSCTPVLAATGDDQHAVR
jgi:hypothetical protein